MQREAFLSSPAFSPEALLLETRDPGAQDPEARDPMIQDLEEAALAKQEVVIFLIFIKHLSLKRKGVGTGAIV